MLQDVARSKSVHNLRSISTVEEGSTSRLSPVLREVVPAAFDQLLEYICKRFSCDFDLYIKKELHPGRKASPGIRILPEGYFRHPADGPDKWRNSVRNYQIRMFLDGAHRHVKLGGAEKMSPTPDHGEDVITITAVYDKDKLTEIALNNQKRVPRLLMQAINAMSEILAHYEDLNKISIRHSKIEAATVYELNKLLSTTYITDVCLDGTFIKEGNYYILLDKGSCLKQLSLCRCFLTDVVCHKIVSKLHFPSPAEKNLLILNLSGNCITDEGAKSIGVMLRSNRNLRYLNLAGNRIEDEGALFIFDALKEFPLTFDEYTEKQRRLFAYLKRKNTLTNKFMKECKMQMTSSHSLVNPAKDSKADVVDAYQRAKLLAKKLIGDLQGSFASENIKIREGWSYCIGNLSLSYLNLAYNNLSYLSVKAILDILRYQAYSENGLFKIILDGNPMPKICTEYGDINTLINKKLTKHVKPQCNRKQQLTRGSGNTKK